MSRTPETSDGQAFRQVGDPLSIESSRRLSASGWDIDPHMVVRPRHGAEIDPGMVIVVDGNNLDPGIYASTRRTEARDVVQQPEIVRARYSPFNDPFDDSWLWRDPGQDKYFQNRGRYDDYRYRDQYDYRYRDPYDYRYRDQYDYRYRDPYDYRYRDQYDYRYRDPYDYRYRDQYDYRYRDQYDYRYRDQYDYRYRDQYDYRYRDQYDYRYRDQYDYRYRDQYDYRYRDQYDYRYRDQYRRNDDYYYYERFGRQRQEPYYDQYNQRNNRRYPHSQYFRNLNVTIDDMLGRSILEYDRNVPERKGCARFVSAAINQATGLPIKDANCQGLESSLRKNGFMQVSLNELTAGDVIIGNRSGSQPGHAAFYVGNGRIAHNNSAERRITLGNVDTFESNSFKRVVAYRFVG